jgi:hypothetical protein
MMRSLQGQHQRKDPQLFARQEQQVQAQLVLTPGVCLLQVAAAHGLPAHTQRHPRP